MNLESKIMKSKKKTNAIKPGGVDEYINKCPKEFQNQLRVMRADIRDV